jgi:hypothetical protein
VRPSYAFVPRVHKPFRNWEFRTEKTEAEGKNYVEGATVLDLRAPPCVPSVRRLFAPPVKSSRASPPHRPQEVGLAQPADTSRSNLFWTSC